MKLRKLVQKDADLMLEWMHDESVVKDLQNNFMTKQMEDCIEFINTAQVCDYNMHMAIVDDEDSYMGTVSLKNINNNSAEFAIVLRTIAMGKGFSKYGMDEILNIGFSKFKLNYIYWYVSPQNKRAIQFYKKNGYKTVRLEQVKLDGNDCDMRLSRYIWYQISRENWKSITN